MTAVQSFIAGGKMKEEVIDGVIDFWNTCDYLEKVPGEYSGGIDPLIKNSTDMAVPSWIKDSRIVSYLNEVQACIQLYVEQYPWAKMADLEVIEPFNIQHYAPGQAFSQPHCERVGSNKTTSFRHLTWMTYLNDVDEDNGGTTDFDYYKIKVKPECGKTLIWPAEWTHAHAGSILKKGEKYIITGWIDFKV